MDKKTNNVLSDDTLNDGLPSILPPYENGVFQMLLTLPEAKIALVGLVEAAIDIPVKSVILRHNTAPSRAISAKQEQYDIH